MKDTPEQKTPPSVTAPRERSPQGGEIRVRWAWVEASVWTNRMLKALETGLGGGKWFRLIDKVRSENNLRSALKAVVAKGGSAGVDGRSVHAVERQSEEEIAQMQKLLRAGEYRPMPVQRTWIAKLGSHEKRPLGVPTVRDRIVQSALRHVIEPIFEREFAPQSYGFRPGRGCKEALRRVDTLLHAGRHWVVDADLKSYFDTIPHDRLMRRVERKIADGRVLELVESYLKAGVMESAKQWRPVEEGTPQGAVISPLLANIYLDPLDWEMAGAGWEMVRYADDFIILCQSEEEAHRALAQVRAWVEQNGLNLHREKTRITDASQRGGGFDFLGYHFERGRKWPRQKSMDKLKEALRRKTRRSEGRSLSMISQDLNRTLVGWFGYFKHSSKQEFARVDGYVRGRLRSILRKRAGSKGRGRGSDHARWPNDYFHSRGLVSLSQLQRLACQSP